MSIKTKSNIFTTTTDALEFLKGLKGYEERLETLGYNLYDDEVEALYTFIGFDEYALEASVTWREDEYFINLSIINELGKELKLKLSTFGQAYGIGSELYGVYLEDEGTLHKQYSLDALGTFDREGGFSKVEALVNRVTVFTAAAGFELDESELYDVIQDALVNAGLSELDEDGYLVEEL